MPRKLHSIPAELPQAETLDLSSLLALIADGSVELICVLGPTASGKTKYAVRLAHALETLSAGTRRFEIISADSRQVYKGMDIGTGKDLCDYDDIPYHLIDIAAPGEQYNVYRFKEDFKAAVDDIRSRGAFPILCGGTGMYISAVTCAYDFKATKPLSEAREMPSTTTFFIGTLVDRDTRNAKIDARLKARIEEGMVDEIRSLLDGSSPACNGKPVSAESLISYGLEYKFVTLYAIGELTLDQMEEQLAIAIHQFAKRQMTWFRGMERSGIRIHWVLPA